MTAETTRAQTLAKQGMETSKSCTNAGKCEVIIQAGFFFGWCYA